MVIIDATNSVQSSTLAGRRGGHERYLTLYGLVVTSFVGAALKLLPAFSSGQTTDLSALAIDALPGYVAR